MPMRLSMALAAGLLFAGTTLAADPPPPQQDPASEVLDKLFNQEVMVEGNVNDMSLLELLNQLSRKNTLTFYINEESFKLAMRLHDFLNRVLESMNATSIVKGNVVEIISVAHAEKLFKAATVDGMEGIKILKEPLVCAIVKQKPLTEAIEQLARRYDLSITINPLAGEAASTVITARILNLPADKAIETLALQSDLRVVRKGNAFMITKPEHAKTLLAEQALQDKNKIELEQLRASCVKNVVLPPQKSETKPLPAVPMAPVSPNR
jgi:type II secretory pathway component GspD/PulD (secretin)